MHRLAAIVAATCALTAGTVTVGATTLPITDADVTTSVTLYGWSRIEVSALSDGTVRTEVFTPAGRWVAVAVGVTVTPEPDGTFTVRYPCPVVDAAGVTVTPEPDGTFTVKFPCPMSDATGVSLGSAVTVARSELGAVTTTMGAPAWSLTFVSDHGRHRLVPVGPTLPCVARILPVVV